ncbi:ribbon-helix-helix domain-containing protein [Sphingopyxis indica]|uniref:ribbon-helix-helix protein, CopG family n=1 Tax=Sphingopyxis indica TaxID=436663 RepID=UPI002938FF16|nr:ribbon-helix-helix protein, CopG family [Sphingopyxis indica]WOF43281.1 ribbon-helix-helix domain-containing protein [Sphingopyxis indica]
MSTPNKHCTVRLDRAKYERVVELAAARQCTPSDIIRAAVESYLAGGMLLSSSQRRIARINEYQHLALDIIIREQFPEYRDRLVAETDRRLEQFHGA